jgi:hypothetical protein
MATAETTTSTPAVSAPIPAWTEVPQVPPAADGYVRFSREAYHRMFEFGVLDRQKRFELLEGQIVMMSPISPDHGAFIRRLNALFVRHLPESIACSPQLPIVIGDQSEPEPDLALIRARDDDYRAGHPRPEDVLLLIEVSQSSLARDCGQKMQIYAQAAVPEYWIIDVEHRAVIVHRQPGPLGYADIQTLKAPSSVAPLAASNCQVDIAWLFR